MKRQTGILILLLSLIFFSYSCKEKAEVKKQGNAPASGSPGIQYTSPAPGSQPDGSAVLNLNLKPGQTYQLTMTTTQKISQKIMDKQQEMNQKVILDYTFAVENVDPSGNASVKVTYNSIRQEMEGPQGKIVYDSRTPADKNNPLSKIFSNFAGKSFNLKITPSGNITEVTGMEKIIQSIVKGMDIPAGVNPKAIEQSINQQFGNEQIRETMENSMAIYPGKPVKPGDTWTKKINLFHSNMPMTVDNTWTLKDVKDGIAYVDLNSKMKSAPNPAGKQANAPIVPDYKMNGNQKGNMEIDQATGWIKSGRIDQKVSGTISIPKNPQMPQGMTVPISVEGSVVMQSKIK